MTTSQSLAGRTIVVTRPAQQARALARLIEDAGASAFLFPAIEIRDVEDIGPFTRLIDRLDEFDLAVFISPNAIERALRLIPARRKLPPQIQIAAIGGGGAQTRPRPRP